MQTSPDRHARDAQGLGLAKHLSHMYIHAIVFIYLSGHLVCIADVSGHEPRCQGVGGLEAWHWGLWIQRLDSVLCT